MRESRLQYEISCAEVRCAKVRSTSQLYGFYGAGLAVLDLRIEWMMVLRTTSVQNPKEDREHMFIYPSIGSQVGVV